MDGSVFNSIFSGTYPYGATGRGLSSAVKGLPTCFDPDYEQRIWDLYEFYRGHHADVMEPHIKQFLGESARQENADGQSQLQEGYLPLVKKIINSISTVFQLPPTYSWADPTTGEPIEDSKASALFDRVIEQSLLWQKVKYAERLVNLGRSCFLQPAWRKKKLRVDVRLPNEVYAEMDRDDPTDIDACPSVSVLCASPAKYDVDKAYIRDLRYMRWTPETCNLYSSDGKRQPNPLFPDDVNHYGAIPVVNWRDIEGEDTLYPEPDDVLYTLQVIVDLLFTDIPDSLRKGANGQPYVITQEQMPTKLSRSVGSLWHIPTDPALAQFGQMQGGADPYSLGKWLDQVITIAAEAYDIPADVFKGDASAISKLISRWDLSISRVDAEALRCIQVRQLYEKIRLVWDYHNPTEKLPPYRLVVRPSLLAVPENVLQTVQAMDTRIKLGLDSPQRILAREEGLTDEEAEALVQKIRTQNETAAPTHSAPPLSVPFSPRPDAAPEVV